MLWKGVDGATLNTDFTAEVTRDGGTTWASASLSDTGYSANGYKVLWAVADVSAQPGGTSVKYRLGTFNNKAQQVKGVAMMTA